MLVWKRVFPQIRAFIEVFGIFSSTLKSGRQPVELPMTPCKFIYHIPHLPTAAMTETHSRKKNPVRKALAFLLPGWFGEKSAVDIQLEQARRMAAFTQRPKPSRDRVNIDSFKDTEENERQRYTEQKPISEGRTAIVYRAYDSRLRRTVAIKRFREDPEINSATHYLAEKESASAIRHTNVVSTYDADRDEEGAFITMEFLQGKNAQLTVSDQGAFSLERFVRFAEDTLEGLSAVHQGGLLHLDIKPTNIMVSEQAGGTEVSKLVDFGRARLMRDAEGKAPQGRGLEGSIYYTSPEQLLGEELDETSDIYCLGCVFYWVLSGRRPFTARNSFELKEAHLQSWVLPLNKVAPDLPMELSDWLMNIITVNRTKRPQSAEEVLQSLKAAPWYINEDATRLSNVETARPTSQLRAVKRAN